MTRTGEKLRPIALAAIVVLSVVSASVALTGAAAGANGAVPTDPYKHGFESNTTGWFEGTDASITRVPTGTNGITASSGNYYVQVTEGTGGVFTAWGHHDAKVFPADGYTTEVDVYLDMSKATTENPKTFQWNSAINDKNSGFLEEAFFQVRTDPDTDNQWQVSLSIVGPTGFISQPRVDITESGWYTFQHHFYNGSDGLLYIDLAVLDADGNVVTNHTYGGYSQYVVDDNVGGSRYGWFYDDAEPDYNPIPVDNACLYLGAPVADGCGFSDGSSDTLPHQIYRVQDNGEGAEEYFTTIQAAIDDSGTQSGDTIEVGPGTYDGFVVNESVTIVGNGDVTITGNSGNGIEVKADDVTLRNLNVTGFDLGEPRFGNGIYVVNGSGVIDSLTIENVSATLNERGLVVNATTTLTDLSIYNSHFDGNYKEGIYFFKELGDDDSTVDGVYIRDTTLNHNGEKGLYAEKLENATLESIQVIGSGVTSDYPFNPDALNGIDINLKDGDYENITINGSTFKATGLVGDNPDWSGALVIKARDDGSYASTPANLTDVTVKDNTFNSTSEDEQIALRFGEVGADNYGPTNVTVVGNGFSGYDRPIWDVTTNSGLDAATIVDANEFDRSVYVDGGSTVYGSIQDAVNASSDGDTAVVGPGTYELDQSLVIQEDNITLESMGSASETIIKIQDQRLITVENTPENFTINGFTLNASGNSKASAIYLHHIDGVVTIKNNSINAAYDAINVYGASGSADVIVINNTIKQPGDNGAEFNFIDDLTFKNNTITQYGDSSESLQHDAALELGEDEGDANGHDYIQDNHVNNDQPATIKIVGNTIQGADKPSDITEGLPAIDLYRIGNGTGVNDSVTIEYNNITNNGIGVNVVDQAEYSVQFNLTIENNTFRNNTVQITSDKANLDITSILNRNDFDRAVTVEQDGSLNSTIWSSIQDAVNNATDGDTIQVVGTHTLTETLVIDESVTLVGVGGAEIFSDSHANDPMIEITAKNVTIEDLTIRQDQGVVSDGDHGDVDGGNVRIEIVIANDVTGTQILNNTIIRASHTSGHPSIHIGSTPTGPGGNNDTLIAGNDLSEAYSIGGFVLGNETITIRNNVLDEHASIYLTGPSFGPIPDNGTNLTVIVEDNGGLVVVRPNEHENGWFTAKHPEPEGDSSVNDDDDEPTSTPPPTENEPTIETTGQAEVSASSTEGALSVDIQNAGAGEQVTVERPPEDVEEQLQETGIALEELKLEFTDRTNFDMAITTSTENPNPDAPEPPTDAVAYIQVSHDDSDEAIGTVEFGFRVTQAQLDAQGLDPDEVALYRYNDGEWVALETEFVGTAPDGSLRFSATSPGLSVFAIGGPPAQQQETPVGPGEQPPDDGAATPAGDVSTPDGGAGDGAGDVDGGTDAPIEEPAGFNLVTILVAIVLAILVAGLFALARRRY